MFSDEIIKTIEDSDGISSDINIIHWLRALVENPGVLLDRVFSLGDLVLSAGSGNPELARLVGIAMLKEVDLFSKNDDDRPRIFPDGELRPIFHEGTDLRNKHVMIMQSFAPAWSEGDLGVNDQFMELLFAIHAAKLASAAEITVVEPYSLYSRSDKKDLPKSSIQARLAADVIQAAGANRIVTIDFHKDQIAGFFGCPVDIVYSRDFFIPKIKERFDLNNLVLIAPDEGIAKRIRKWSEKIFGHETIGVISKSRDLKNGGSKSLFYNGPNLTGKDAVIIDDIIAGGSTVLEAAKIITDEGAKSVSVIAAHALLLGNALDKFKNSLIKEVWVTNTIRQRPEVYDSDVTGGKVTVHNIASFLADKLINVHTGKTMGLD